MNLQKGLIGYWSLDLSSNDNGVVRDNSAGNYSLNIKGKAGFVNDGRINEGLAFGENDQALTTGTKEYDLLDLRESFSITAWVKVQSTSRQYIVSKNIDSGFYDQQYLIGTNGGHLEVVIGGESYDAEDGNPFPDSWGSTFDVWKQVAFTWDGEQITTYGGGEVLATHNHTQNPEFKPNLTIGARSNSSNRTDFGFEFDGQIDEVRIYNRKLTQKEINKIKEIRNNRSRNA